MLSARKYLKTFVGICLILLQATSSWCEDLSSSVVKIYSGQRYLCAGTLVRENFVLTLAECVQERHPKLLFYVLSNYIEGEFSRSDISPVADIFIPPNYNSKLKYMDVAVLKLEISFEGAKYKPAKLCSKQSIAANESAMLYYWDSASIRRHLAHYLDLKMLELSVSRKEICEAASYVLFSDTVFCAAGDEKFQCFNDRGGPAVMAGEICGIYRYGPYCIKNSEPGSLTSLASPEVIKFIEESLEK